MSNDFFEQFLGKNHFFPDIRTAATFPVFTCGLIDSDSNIGDLRADGKAYVPRQSPWCRRPCKNRGLIIDQFEFDINRGLDDLLVAQSHFVTGVRGSCLRTVG